MLATERPADLPDFKNPPLVEVVLSVQFSELRNYRTVHAGLLWQRFRQAYPKFAEHPNLNPTFEAFGIHSPAQPRFELRQLPGPLVPRLWFINADDTELLQFQADRFIHNWRKMKGADYPRYESLRDRFFARLGEVETFLQDESIGKIEPNQCEVTYVNMIRLDDETDIRVRPEVALRVWSAVDLADSDAFARLPQMENASFSIRYVMKSAEDAPLGRLVVAAQPVGGQPELRLDLTARGAPDKPSLDAVARFFDQGRDAIVRGFTALTTPYMHRVWGRIK
jgi:uncharacterized protein (TIGR04255 family)